MSQRHTWKQACAISSRVIYFNLSSSSNHDSRWSEDEKSWKMANWNVQCQSASTLCAEKQKNNETSSKGIMKSKMCKQEKCWKFIFVGEKIKIKKLFFLIIGRIELSDMWNNEKVEKPEKYFTTHEKSWKWSEMKKNPLLSRLRK